MSTNPRRPAVQAAGALHVEHCDIPVDMTIGEWRRSCAAERQIEVAPERGGAVRRGLRRLLGA